MMHTTLALLLTALACAACSAPDATGVTSAEHATETPVVENENAPPSITGSATRPAIPPDGWRGVTLAAMSNDGTYRVHYRPVDGPIERGEPFALEVWVLDPSSDRPRTDVTLAVDAAMPEHEHGMNREPRVTPSDTSAAGTFEVEGMLFHMLGRWELYLDVTSGAVTERAQFEVLLE